MTRIKIISNPYQKTIDYQRYDEFEKEWESITDDPKYTGKLKAEKMLHGFFPFIVGEVVDDIIDEYDDSKEKIQIFFDGTPDEYADLRAICSSQELPKKKVDLQPIGRQLSNAYQVLPNIVDIFDKSVRPIVSKSVSAESSSREAVDSNLSKYSETTNNIIPICVIGNYSAGKSTFINALIGNEILPSGDKAITARVYKIYQAKDVQAANISFTVGDEKVSVDLFEDGFRLPEDKLESHVVIKLNEALSAISEAGYTVRVNKALSVLNGFINSEEESLGQIIEIHIPFRKGLWDEFAGEFMILDTPGSNAASHADHKEVLTEAMKGMSNGIPVFVAERDSLDSTDNESLYDLVKEMKGLDPRFTMIIVNKADAANLPGEGFSEESEDEILHEAIPKNLYSSGIYFVSSIFGLGAKNEGFFIDYHCDDIFEGYKARFLDETNRHYKQLYKYNIMPIQIKGKAIKSAEEKAGEDKLYANSGLFSVEDAIQTFASRYASYNKCHQAKMYLEEIIKDTKKELEISTANRERAKKEMEDRLEKDKHDMILNVESAAAIEVNSYKHSYADVMAPILKQSKVYPSVQDLKTLEQLLTERQQGNMDIELLREDAKQQKADVGEAFKGGFHKLSKSFSIGTIKEFGSSVIKETREAIDSQNALHATNRAADRAAADDLIKLTNKNFCIQAEAAEQEMDDAARNYWIECSMAFRERLSEVVKNTSLSEKKKHELTELIVTYRKLELDAVESQNIFQVDEFDYLLNFGDFKLFKSDKLFLNRLSGAYKSRISEAVNKVDHNIHDAYLNSFIAWEENLVNIVRTNIVEYSPELREQQKKIDDETANIQDLRDRQRRLQVYSEDISSMIDWKEA